MGGHFGRVILRVLVIRKKKVITVYGEGCSLNIVIIIL